MRFERVLCSFIFDIGDNNALCIIIIKIPITIIINIIRIITIMTLHAWTKIPLQLFSVEDKQKKIRKT